MPIGIFVQSPFHIAFCSRVKVQVLVETGADRSSAALPQPLLVGLFLIWGQQP
jgi:hypothetical protein